MMAGIFPSDPSRRKAILVLQQHDLEKCAYEPGAAKSLFDEETHILQFPARQQGAVPQALRNIVDAGLDRPGSVLVQSPFDADTYEEASLAPQRFALAKHMYFSTLCMYLGAKEVSVEQIDLRTRTGKSSASVKGDGLGASADGHVQAEELERFRAQLNLRDEFAGAAPDIPAAEGLLRRTGLLADLNMRTLLEMRRGSMNHLLTRKLTLSLSNEAKNNLNVVARLKVPKFVTLSVEYDRVLKEQHDYTLTVVVKF
ncbi:hypothetical protein [Achromobacter arsenitoxydans]|uniref:Uncharacterized protein n=1 Tax=Achromobacter arsenitoxydans SY8 TaxID=477184 RepID=H0FEE1_9BURK|nr:hypothetical protein [Achromobacter arsenitoxydans]EHK63377.1 hypothetical protein KYC_25763 [Achromobacter arsenitoxydans SY8]